jgi:hypothetical protein
MGVARVISQLIGKWRGRSNRAWMIDPAALSDYMQRDLGFRDGHATPASIARAAADRAAWR